MTAPVHKAPEDNIRPVYYKNKLTEQEWAILLDLLWEQSGIHTGPKGVPTPSNELLHNIYKKLISYHRCEIWEDT